MKPASAHFFLGANTPQGFYSLYDQLMTPDNAVYVLKGGPGCGKSSFMRHVADALQEPVEYIHCSGDPDSLDAVHFPRLHTVIVDGTAPHVIEPRYPGVLDTYIDLGRSYQTELLAAHKDGICALSDQCSRQYQRAYRILSAAQKMTALLPPDAISPLAAAKMEKRIRTLAARELKKTVSGGPGTLTRRFLGGLTCQGILCRFDTVDALCSRVYACVDPYGLAHAAFTVLQNAALEAGYSVIACPAPMEPDRIEHILIPALSLAFITTKDTLPYEGEPVRNLRFDNLLDPDWLKRNRARLRFHKKMTRILTEDATAAFLEAKQTHDALEQLYNPCVSFETVYQAADDLIVRLKQR